MNRRTALKQLAALGVLASPAAAALAQDAGFVVVNPPQPTDEPARIEVVKFFHYGCSHCANLAPLLSLWAKQQADDVVLRHVPAQWNNPQLEGLARFYYTAEATGDIGALHDKVFAAVQQQRVPLHTEAGVRSWIAGKVADEKRFMDTYKSFGVQSMLQRGDQRARAFKIQGVPTLVVDGKYLTSSSMAGGHEGAIRMLDQLVARARADRKG
ncbi:thiol:disulfide interchange protein DsbA/DsbL [Pseudothauera nasutitermitis]|uniref:Thiol:disulfide interchange protein n=1 Tax=Pseudothauera nasutitermitis TaxID=2565930 RepID=A0A4S4AZJ0_9RHOO|nr:thiol:disulfide interchange protein DsbA/DsbL [Pseudothauera nasutitermitis]THF64042.1 thiol:disulfide interchange protein DsbA/DsbL [Pseudothauera nasutitermitis]